MGLFDRFSGKKPTPPAPAARVTDAAETAPAAAAGAAGTAGAAKPKLAAAREKLEAKDLPAALALYDEVLGAAGDRADVLVAISGDLGTHGHVTEIIELVAPRYDAERHGPATGLNILQAYLAVRNPDAAQHVLDILFALNRPELEDRLHGFSNAIAEQLANTGMGLGMSNAAGGPPGGGGEMPKVSIVSISKPIWFYGLEPLADAILPRRDSRVRRIAFAQLAVLGIKDVNEAMKRPEDELGRLSRALPLWLAETFSFSTLYAPIAALAVMAHPDGANHHMIFSAEWSTENLRQLVDSTSEGLDYVFTGALRQQAGDYELVLRVWEVKKFRERKSFLARWTPASADAELAKLHEQVRLFMEWAPAQTDFAYAPPARPRAWLDVLGASAGLFLAEKKLLPVDQLSPVADALAAAAGQTADSEAASLAWLTLRLRAAGLDVAAPDQPALVDSPLVDEARELLGG